MKKHILILIILVTILMDACPHSLMNIHTDIPQPQAANPSPTNTPVPPTNTPTETPTQTQTTTPASPLDLTVLQANLKEFLVQTSDIPLLANYSPYFTNPPINVSNESFSESIGSNGDETVAETGRIDGWEVTIDYKGDPNLAIAALRINSQAVLYKTSEGAQSAIRNDSDRYVYEYGYSEEINPPKIGDVWRAFYLRTQEETNSSEYSLNYIFEYSTRNVVEILQESGMERNVDPVFVMDIAQRLLTRLQAARLVNP